MEENTSPEAQEISGEPVQEEPEQVEETTQDETGIEEYEEYELEEDEPVYLYETIYPVSDDGAITVVHEITLGDVIISTILIALLVFTVLDRLIRR